MRIPLGLRGRSIVLCVTLVLATAATLGSVSIWEDYHSSLAEMRKHAVVYTKAMSDMAEPAVLLADHPALQRVVLAAAQDPTIESAEILDLHGRSLGSYRQHSGDARGPDLDPRQFMPEPITRSSVATRQSKTDLQVVVPIWRKASKIDMGLVDGESDEQPQADAPIGFVYLSYSLEGISRDLTARVFGSVALAALVITAGIGATLAGVQKLLLPLRDLARTTRAIADGDRGTRVGEQAVGELGELARSFNHMADRLAESYGAIEQKVVERTAELNARRDQLEAEIAERRRIESQLLDAKEAAEAANRAKSDFLANMSHEIRTPLTAILGFMETLLDSTLSETERMDASATIRRNGGHLLQIIGDILDISRIEAGQLKVERLGCRIVKLIAEIESLMRPRALEKGLAFGVEFPSSIPESIETDPTRLRQILINLLGNAIKFTAHGGIRLRISLVNGTPAAGGDLEPRLQFDVVDSGIGLTPEQAARIFQPFTQADETVTRRFGGTGLGLAISQRLANMLGGTINVASRPGEGSTFTVTIATGRLAGVRLLKSEELHAPAETPPAPERDTVRDLRGCRVLLAEDGPDNQRLIAYLLRKANAEVTIVDNGKLAIEAFRAARTSARPFDVVLMDMQMPVLDGYKATAALRTEGFGATVIALTAHAMEGDREKCLQAGCDDYVTKPIDRQSLLDTIWLHYGKLKPVSATR